MKYFLIIGSGAVVVGLLLTLATEHFFDGWVSSFLVEFLAVPIGLCVSILLFIIYDTQYPKKKEVASKKKDKDRT